MSESPFELYPYQQAFHDAVLSIDKQGHRLRFLIGKGRYGHTYLVCEYCHKFLPTDKKCAKKPTA